MWLEMGFFDGILKYLCILEMQKVLKVPITVSSVSISFAKNFQAQIVLNEIRVKPPPISCDDRWEVEDIVKVEVVKVSFPFFASCYLYLCSWGNLFFIDSLSVHGVRFYIEGYREIDDKIVYNISLLGKKLEEVLPLGVEQLVITNDMEDVVIVDNYFSVSTTGGGTHGRNTKEALFNSSVKKKNYMELDRPLSEKLQSVGKERDSTTPFSSTEVSYHPTDYIHSAKEKLQNIYESAKHSIEERIYEKLNQLHVYVQGPEPIAQANGARMICRYLVFDYIEINFIRALPYGLRHIERKPVSVKVLDFSFLGYDNLEIFQGFPTREHKTPVDDVTSTCISCHDSIIYPQKNLHKIVCVCKRCSNSSRSLKNSRFPYTDKSPLITKAGNSNEYVSPIEGEYMHNESVDDLNDVQNCGDFSDAGDSKTATFSDSSNPYEIALFVNIFSIPLKTAGLDVVVFKYWFERKLLFGLYKQNMKRLAQDILSFRSYATQNEVNARDSYEQIEVCTSPQQNESISTINRAWVNRGFVDAHPIFF
jgi:uncharacterized protein (UPF0297 family)